ncbi:clumping factor A-like [Eucalyptus grandis]|uniref:clumping factor A-like n=1 Tax=Eucalyptus grandis TaxID=71139 RepID=UPI00192EA686|nr:clumping factor A-like [Eucalyptus grandis]
MKGHRQWIKQISVYEYHSDFVLGDSSHTGLGYCNEYNAAPTGIKASSGKMENREESQSGMSSPEQEVDYRESFDSGAAEKGAQLLSKDTSTKENSGFVSIGGLEIYTEYISDEEDGEDDVAAYGDEEDSESESAEQDRATDSFESDDSENMSDSGSDVDDEIAQDYLEGIGGSDSLLDAKNLLQQVSSSSDDADDSSSSDLDETMKKLGGIALQDASTEYGMQRKRQSKHQGLGNVRDNWSSAVDDFILVKDVRTPSAKKNRGTRVPQSQSLGSQKSTRSRRFPGEKKKHRKELIAAKRRDRMIRRGVDLESINKVRVEVSGSCKGILPSSP